MGDRMHVELVVGPLTENQKNRLPDVMADFCRDLGIDYDPEPFESDPRRIRFSIDEINYGLETLGTVTGRLEFLIDECMPYRVTDDGGSYADGTDAIWTPAFGDLAPLIRPANKRFEVVVSETLIAKLAPLSDEAIGKVLRGLVRTDPTDPALAESYLFVARNLDMVL